MMAPQARGDRRSRQQEDDGDRLQPFAPPGHQGSNPTANTHADAEFLSAAWGEIEPEVRRVLRSLLQPTDIDDVVQEVFIRLAARTERGPLATEAVSDLARLAAWRLGLNAVRDASARAQPRAELPEAVALTDIEEQAVWHMDLGRVLLAIDGMSDADRQAIVRALSPARGSTKREQDLLSLRLFRARGRLRARITGVLGGLPIWRWRPWQLHLVEVAGSATASVFVAAVVTAIATAPHPSPSAIPLITLSAEATMTPPPSRPPATVADPPRTAARRTSTPDAAPEALTPPPNGNQYARFAVPKPGGNGEAASVGGGDRQQEELACLGGGPLSQDVCVPHPLRP